MNTDRGMFDQPDPKPVRQESPFSVAPGPTVPISPFAPSPARVDSPFTIAGHPPLPSKDEGKSRLPERRRPVESGFASPPPGEAFGFEAPSPAAATAFPPPSFAPPQQPVPSPFAVDPAPRQPPAAAADPQGSAFAAWHQQPPATAAELPAQPANDISDSSSIKQLELRAIFGMDREMTSEEIMQRARALPGLRHVARVNPEDLAAVDRLQRVLGKLGFGQGGLKIVLGSTPVEFIREGNVQLAVQTEGGFGPGVRETLILVARELGRMA